MQGMTEGDSQKLIVAVSGGVDSVVLLDRLVHKGREVVVAHIDHGIRPDSADDAKFVETLSAQYNLPFVSIRLNLSPDTSEEVARNKRYEWLESVRKKYGAQAIATAHHQDDVLETIVLNLVRGTGWRGLGSLRSTELRYRPLLDVSKAQIVEYALENRLSWREDSTNDSMQYLRNRIRWLIVPRITQTQRERLLSLNTSQLELRDLVDTEVQRLCESYSEDGALSRYPLIMAAPAVAYELLRQWLGESLELSRFDQLLHFAKTAKPGAKWSLDSERFVVASRTRLIVTSPRD